MCDKRLALGALFIQPLRNFTIHLRMGKAKTQILEFPLDLPHAQTVRQRRVQLQRLLGHRHWTLGFARRIVAQSL